MAGVRKIVVAGKGRERGRAHGEALRDLIHEHYNRWLDKIGADLGVDPRDYVRRFLSETEFLSAIEKWTPDILEEVRGLAEGANAPFDVAFARQLSDEEPWYRREWKLNAAPSHGGCSSIGVWSGEGDTTIVAQNMDMPHWCDGLQILLHLKPEEGPEIFQFTLAGKINLAGMNSAGLAICCNTLSQLDYSRKGLAEDFVVRGFLERRTLSGGLEFMRSVEHASGQNYTLGAPGARAVNLECSARSVTEFIPAAPANCVYHTNHPFTNEDRGIFASQSKGMTDAEKRKFYYGSSYERFADIERRMTAHKGPISIEAVKQIFSSHAGGVCRHGEEQGRYDAFTLGCLIMALGETPELHLAPGPPCRTAFETFRF